MEQNSKKSPFGLSLYQEPSTSQFSKLILVHRTPSSSLAMESRPRLSLLMMLHLHHHEEGDEHLSALCAVGPHLALFDPCSVLFFPNVPDLLTKIGISFQPTSFFVIRLSLDIFHNVL